VGGVELVAVYNRTRAKAEAVAREFGVPRVYDDPGELFEKEDLDFVDIITEVPAHAPFVLMAAENRVPVICQKPMAADCETCERMVAACESAGVPFFVHENFRRQVPIRALKERLDGGAIGAPFRARIQFVHGFPVFDNQPFLKTLERFVITDVGSHLLDLARYFFGEAQSLYCQTFRTRGDIAGEDVASILLRMGDVICTCELSQSTRTEWGRFPETFAYIEGTNGTLDLGPDFWIRATTDQGTFSRRHPPPRYPWADPDYDVVHASIVPTNAEFLAALKTGTEPETSGADNLKTMRLVHSAYDSAARNQVVHFA
jgi:predicted dehydrogenase